jgi:class I fructose-bisphosphate aldolase
MTDRVREILSGYGSNNPGTLTNLARANHGRLGGSGKLVILPVDQGFELGPACSFAPNPPAYDPRYHFQLARTPAAARTRRRSASSKRGRANSPAMCRSS